MNQHHTNPIKPFFDHHNHPITLCTRSSIPTTSLLRLRTELDPNDVSQHSPLGNPRASAPFASPSTAVYAATTMPHESSAGVVVFREEYCKCPTIGEQKFGTIKAFENHRKGRQDSRYYMNQCLKMAFETALANPTVDLKVVIEITKGNKVKYELDKKTGS